MKLLAAHVAACTSLLIATARPLNLLPIAPWRHTNPPRAPLLDQLPACPLVWLIEALQRRSVITSRSGASPPIAPAQEAPVRARRVYANRNIPASLGAAGIGEICSRTEDGCRFGGSLPAAALDISVTKT